MKLKDFLKYFNEGISIAVYDNFNKNLYEGKIYDTPSELLNRELDNNDIIDIIVDMDYMGYGVSLEIYVK